jgi:hypothetical protein
VQAPGQQLPETLIASTYEVLWVGAIVLGGKGNNGGWVQWAKQVHIERLKVSRRWGLLPVEDHQVYILRVYKARRL